MMIRAWVLTAVVATAATWTVRRELLKAMAADDCGLIVDVSANLGGNMWPMMGGMAPLYDEGVLETFRGRNGPDEAVDVRNGVLRMNEQVFPRVDDLTPLPTKPRFIALILGRLTASSGEIIAVGFRHQANVRFFGEPTAGKTTANTPQRLANGGRLGITTARILDRTGSVQQGPITPDTITSLPLEAARQWLARRCPVSKKPR